MNEINCTDETFDLNYSPEYKLYMQVGLDGFSFCILDDIRKKYLVFKHFPFSLSNNLFLLRKVKEIVKNEEILNLKYKKVLVSFVSPKLTLIPPDLTEIDEEVIVNFNMDIISDEVISSFYPDEFEVKIIYVFSEKIADFFRSHFENSVLIHQVKTLFQLFSEKKKPGQTQAFISVSKKFFTIFVGEGERLLLVNSFGYINDMDFTFFMLKVFESLSVNTLNTIIYLAGKISESSDLVEFMKKHFQKVEFYKLAKDYQYSYTFSKFSPHSFVTVINPEG